MRSLDCAFVGTIDFLHSRQRREFEGMMVLVVAVALVRKALEGKRGREAGRSRAGRAAVWTSRKRCCKIRVACLSNLRFSTLRLSFYSASWAALLTGQPLPAQTMVMPALLAPLVPRTL